MMSFLHTLSDILMDLPSVGTLIGYVVTGLLGAGIHKHVSHQSGIQKFDGEFLARKEFETFRKEYRDDQRRIYDKVEKLTIMVSSLVGPTHE